MTTSGRARVRRCRAVALRLGAAVAAFAANGPARADDGSFRGRQLTLIVSHEPGGSYDFYAKLVANRLGKFIAGRPAIIPKNMPSAGGFKAASWLYHQAPRDGTVFGTVAQNAAIAQAFHDSHVDYDARRFNWLARIASSVDVSVAWHTAKVKTIEEAMHEELVVGATGIQAASGLNPLVLNRMVGTRFKIVTGYPGMKGILLALEQGEVPGGYATVGTLVSDKPDWLVDRKVAVLVQYAEARNPAFPDAPTMVELVRNDEDRRVLALLASGAEIGRSFIAPPGAPPPAVATLRKAFADLFADPAFGAELMAKKIEFEPMSGENLQKRITAILDAPAAIAARAAEVSAPSGDPRER